MDGGVFEVALEGLFGGLADGPDVFAGIGDDGFHVAAAAHEGDFDGFPILGERAGAPGVDAGFECGVVSGEDVSEAAAAVADCAEDFERLGESDAIDVHGDGPGGLHVGADGRAGLLLNGADDFGERLRVGMDGDESPAGEDPFSNKDDRE